MKTAKTGRTVIGYRADGTSGWRQVCHKPETASGVAQKLRRKVAKARAMKNLRTGSELWMYAQIVDVTVE